jgi:hypothetical protein
VWEMVAGFLFSMRCFLHQWLRNHIVQIILHSIPNCMRLIYSTFIGQHSHSRTRWTIYVTYGH